jgi:hypothetical protein
VNNHGKHKSKDKEKDPRRRSMNIRGRHRSERKSRE